jgi:Kef-type K+ transport system membrane component KefB
VAALVAWFVLPRLVNWLDSHADSKNSFGNAAAALITVLVFGWSAEYLGGLAAITGAFIAGVGLSRVHAGAKRDIDLAVSNISYAFLVPVFFISVGLQTDLSTYPLTALPLTVLILLVAIISKVLGCGLGGRLGGFDNWQALRLGVCMISRGEVGLIVASLGLSTGVLRANDPLFASLFMVIVLTTVITPPFVRRSFQIGRASVSRPVIETRREMVETGG